jgi:hypothetical protein
MTKHSTTPEISNAELAALHVAALTDGKARYKEADAALDALLKQAKVGEVITLPNQKPIPVDLRGKKFVISDKFAKRNSIGVGLSARRYELEELATP